MHLDVGDGHQVWFSTAGDPAGPPALFVHGGPGSGTTERSGRLLVEQGYRVVLVDQRMSGRSRPHASDPAADLAANTTPHLIADFERIREHLGIGRWLLYGGSWGSTLALAYAQQHPERVTRIVLAAVTTSRRQEIHWLYAGSGRFFPEEWERFRDAVPGHDVRTRDDDVRPLLAAYGRAVADAEPAVRQAAARSWLAWEDTLISQEVNGSPGAFSARVGDAALAFVRTCAHYFTHDVFLDGSVMRDAHRLAGIPGTLVHGRADLSGPADTAWELAGRWPDAELTIVSDAGHTSSPAMDDVLRRALRPG